MMDKERCFLIKDLLPLYIDELCSNESTEIIKNHLEICPSCRKEYQQLAKQPEIKVVNNDSTELIKGVGNMFERDKRKAVIKTVSIFWVVIIVVPLMLWLSSLLKCEALTQKYYKDFEYAYTQNSMLSDMACFKVLSCDGETAEVYYVSEGMTDANVLTFKYNKGAWVETNWETIWSSTGSASGVIFPYWWHFIYGGL